ncbi:MAG: hypothetical protein ACI4L8_12985 [Candidatus Fimadaptatus sp.]
MTECLSPAQALFQQSKHDALQLFLRRDAPAAKQGKQREADLADYAISNKVDAPGIFAAALFRGHFFKHTTHINLSAKVQMNLHTCS